ncbi:MAG: ABC transporter permease [Atopobiaceae bacterium]|jgi:ribose transport system permease protein|nr:ABC transporter permease [Atopobiaceae bacterium]MCH4180293.1 ABC transporter permease [Atopobiaceae bacterium]MCH4214897.1 ABC transporter permease [Atopobiaceae bacterium]MCH4229334.1 ABC transporter permease [Atopobiaceae bacterium]MCH4276389.1 ABC transporter permease [Atopobiaceae bacterium]
MATTDTATLDPKAPAPQAEEEPKKKFGLASLRPFLPIIGFAVILLFFTVATNGSIITPKNIRLMLSQTYMIMIAAVGVFMIMTMGCLDFSQGSMLGLSCIVVCYLSNYNIVLAIIGGIVTGALIGAVNAYFHVYRQIQSFVVTLCMMFLLRGVVAFLTTDAPVMGANYLSSLNDPMIMIPIMVVVLVLGYLVFHFTSVGPDLKAIGAGEKGARFAGIKVNRTKVIVYIVAGCITGFAAFVNAAKVGSVTATGGNMFETQLLIALVLGGMPINGGARVSYANIIVGVLSYRILASGLVMLGFTTEIQQLIMGVVFVLVVAAFSDRKSNQVIK